MSSAAIRSMGAGMAAGMFLVILFLRPPDATLQAQEYDAGEATEVFGIAANGSRFVYVFDKSGSTEGAPLTAAKAELLKSLERLKRVHQFQIVFYNHRPQVYSSGGEPRLFWAERANKQSAEKFIKRILAGGGTNHLDALSAALRMNPDVVFLYTDAEEPRLSDDDLSRVRRLNRSATIHVIEFGRGAKGQEQGENFLSRLAQQNAGKYRYLDLDEWLAERDSQ